jgi:hypothetical protein
MPEDIPPLENWETDEGWLCPCGACMDHDLHCDHCGAEPPWGCPCDECGEPRDGDDTWNEG